MGRTEVKVRWTRRALRQFIHAQDYIAQESPVAAQSIAHHVLDAVDLLLSQPSIGRVGRIDGTREWPVKQTPYLLAYRHDADTIQILAVIHSKQRWPDALS